MRNLPSELSKDSDFTIFRGPFVFLVLFILMGWLFADSLQYLVGELTKSEEYSHALFLPLIALFFVWLKTPEMRRITVRYPRTGILVVLFGIGLFLLGELSTLYIVQQYAFLVVLAGFVVLYGGWRLLRLLLGPLGLLVFVIPLPDFLYIQLSNRLQLISSQLGVEVIRTFGISVFLEGNVIDLGNYQLQVVEACSGLRYLFPLAAVGYICAYIFKGAMWKKVILFLSTIPITVLMNSFRIGVIGVLVEYWGEDMAEGFLHDFEGWAVFMACAGVLLLEMAVLTRVGRDRLPLRDAFRIAFPPTPANGFPGSSRPASSLFYFGLLLLPLVAMADQLLPERREAAPEREVFALFPMDIDGWHGTRERLAQAYVDALQFDDYIIADYRSVESDAVNLYLAYYSSQRKGASAHSPRTCIPGGGWEITQFSRHEVSGVSISNEPLRVNRTLIQLGDSKQLVYYWFQQRGRLLTNEYLVKWFLFWDALTRSRTDGALVRLTTVLPPGSDPAEGDARLAAFAASIARPLARFIPD